MLTTEARRNTDANEEDKKQEQDHQRFCAKKNEELFKLDSQIKDRQSKLNEIDIDQLLERIGKLTKEIEKIEDPDLLQTEDELDKQIKVQEDLISHFTKKIEERRQK